MARTFAPVYDEDDIICDMKHQWFLYKTGLSNDEHAMGQEMQGRLRELADEMTKTGKVVSWEDINNELLTIGDRYGHEYGVPIPAPDYDDGGLHEVVMARGTPLRRTLRINQIIADQPRTELERAMVRIGASVRNSWVSDGKTIMILNSTEGPIAYWEHHKATIAKLWDSLEVRMSTPTMSVESEERAIQLLKEKVNPAQYRCYMLNGIFAEKSKRSDLHYLFRKGYPTIVLSFHGAAKGKVISCLCMHPFGYYAGTWAGMMTPTDEVIAALMMMRGDEAKFWAKSGQWPAYDPRSGL